MKPDPKAVGVRVTSKALEVELADGRRISTPISWFPRLARASVRDRARWELLGGGIGIHWTAIDEDLSVAGLLQGTSLPKGARRYPRSNPTTDSMLARDSAKRPYRVRTSRASRKKAGRG
ncbi:MAG: DUF2442 domain-containing protein [Planctomycetes bacterium]|nr:DUF2442 domain-containing protein [Planctomycetota bacterium]